MPQPIYRQGNSPSNHWIVAWVGPRAVLDAVMKRQIPSPSRESNPGNLIIKLSKAKVSGKYLLISFEIMF